MQKFFSPKLLLLLLPLAVIVISLFALFNKPARPAPTLLSSTPADDTKSASPYEPVTLVFDSPVDPSLITITSSPTEDWSVTPGRNNALLLDHRQILRVGTEYSLELYYQNEPLTTLTFTTLEQQSDPRYVEEVLEQMDRDYPLNTVFPYETPLYQVIYTEPMVLQITLKRAGISESDAISQVKSLVRNEGGDAAAHTYRVIPAPSPSPTSEPSIDEFGEEIVPPASPTDPLYY